MGKSLRRLLCAGLPVVLAAALALAWLCAPPHFSASLYDLIGPAAERIPAFLRKASQSEIAIIFSSSETGSVARAAANWRRNHPATNGAPEQAIAFIRDNRGGLVTPESAALLATPEGRSKIAKRAIRKLYTSPVPPVLGFVEDPFALTDEFLKTLAPPSMRRTAEGFPLVITNGLAHVLVKDTVPSGMSADMDKTIEYVGALSAYLRKWHTENVEVHLAGAPVHTAYSALRSKAEIGALSWFSLLFIAVLALFVFRSVRWIPLLASSLLVSSLAGALVLVLFFRDLHVMTFVMGTTVLGLVIDYSFHWLLSPAAEKPAVRRNLFVSFLTTEISLVPLVMSTIPVLRQSALFLGVGLLAAFLYVLVGYPRGDGAPAGAHARLACTSGLKGCRVLILGLIGLSAFCLVRFPLQVGTRMTALYHPPAQLIEAEKLHAVFNAFDLSRIPDHAARRVQAENVRRLYAEHGAKMAEALQVDALTPPPEPTDLILRPQALLESIFAGWTRETLQRLALSVLVLVVVLLVLCRRRALAVIAPSLAAFVVVAGVLAATGTSLNLFHLLAAFLLLGMGIDYAVFLQSGSVGSLRPALCSLLTSVAGFGALAFVSFPVVRSFGLVLGLGLPVSFLAALALRPRPRSPRPSTERAASLPGMETLWIFYRLFGLKALHLLSRGVALCVWLCAPSVRKASPSSRKMLNFAQSLADKLVVMAEGKRLPTVVTDGSPDARDFLKDVGEGKGVFILSSHIGTIEVLTALGSCERMFHAWMDFDRTGVFNRFYLRHARRKRVVIHPITSFGMGTVFKAGDLIDAGDCLVMAGDRGEGAFSFAAAFDHPVYFVACIAEGDTTYRAVIRHLPNDRKPMKAAYEELLTALITRYPAQHFVWE